MESENNSDGCKVTDLPDPVQEVRPVEKVSQGTIQLLKDHIQHKYTKNCMTTRGPELVDRNKHDTKLVDRNKDDTRLIAQSDNFATVGELIKGKFRLMTINLYYVQGSKPSESIS